MNDNAHEKRPSLIKEALKSISWISTWFDYRAFSKQRHRLLEDPGLALTVPAKTDLPWKSPLSFAIQGLVLTTLTIQLTGSAFALVLSRPEPYTERIRTTVQENLRSLNRTAQTLRDNLAIVEGADDNALFEPVFDVLKTPVRANNYGVPKTVYVKALKGDIAQIERTLAQAQSESDELARQLDLAKKAEQLPSTLFRTLLPLALVFSAYIFRFLFEKRKETRSTEKKDYSDVAYLYITTSHLFWMNIVLSIATVLIHNAFIYSGLYDSEMSKSLGSLGLTQLLFSEAEITGPFVLCLPFIIIAFRNTSAAIRTIFTLPPQTAGWIASYIRVSNFISFLLLSIVLVLFSLGYAKIATKWGKHQISLDQYQTVVGINSTEFAWESETVVPKGNSPDAGKTINRRYTNIWMKREGKWRLIARHASVICQN